MNMHELLRSVVAIVGSIGLLAMPTLAVGALIDFEKFDVGSPVTSVDGATFASNIGLDLVVSTGFDTTSGSKYLGVDDGGLEVFLPGDLVALELDAFYRNASVNFITTPFTPLGAFGLVALSDIGIVASKTSIALPSLVLPDGGEVFSLSLSLPAKDAFDELHLVSTALGIYSYSIDDIAFSVVSPAALPVFSLGLVMLFCSRARAGHGPSMS